MKTTLSTLIMILVASFVFAQQGINYKALITDNGNTVANQSVEIKFTILENGITTVYQEEHAITTDSNGILIANIGEGIQISGDFGTIDWRVQVFLKVEINTGSGYIDFGTTGFKTVPHAKSAEKLLPTDKIIIGETDTYSSEKLYVKNVNPDSELVDFRVGDLTSGKDILNLYIDENTSGSGSNNRSQFIEASKGSSLKFKVDDDGRVFSKKGYYTDGYMVATGNIETYSNIKSYGNLEVDGEVTSDLKMGDNKIRGAASGDADMKAFMYGHFSIGCGITAGEELSNISSTDGFSVVYLNIGRYEVVFDDYNLRTQIQKFNVQITSEGDYAFTAGGTPLFVPTIFVMNKESDKLYIRQYDLNGNLSNAGASHCGHNPGFDIMIFKK